MIDMKDKPVSEVYVETSVINGSLPRDSQIALISSVFWDRVKAGELVSDSQINYSAAKKQ
jgi:hypothetical protein